MLTLEGITKLKQYEGQNHNLFLCRPCSPDRRTAVRYRSSLPLCRRLRSRLYV